MVNLFMLGNMSRVVSSIFVFVYSSLFYVLGSIFRQILRFRLRKNFEKRETDNHQIDSGWSGEAETDKINGERENSVVKETAGSSVSTRKYEFLSGKGISGYVEEPKTFSFTLHEAVHDSHGDDKINPTPILDPGGYIGDDNFHEDELEAEDVVADEAEDFVESVAFVDHPQQETLIEDKSSDEEEIAFDAGLSKDEGFGKTELDGKAFIEEKAEDSVPSLDNVEEMDEDEHEILVKEKISEEGKWDALEDSFEGKHCAFDQVQFVSRCYSFPCDTKEESVYSNIGFCASNYHIHSSDSVNEFWADRISTESCVVIDEEKEEENKTYSQQPEAVIGREQFNELDDDYIELELQKHNSNLMEEEKHEQQDSSHEEAESRTDFSENNEETGSPEKKCFSNSDDQDDLDFTYEHEDIVEQLKMELKLARTGGLPTILEESEPETLETPKIVPELKPLKIDEKFEHKDLVDEIQKVYRSYLDKMRKLDILNFQTMHAVGLLQLKDTVELQIGRKSSRLGKKNSLYQNFWSCKQGIAVVEPATKIVADMHKDFELVYVGQLCLSWEILHWQFQKLHELQKYDPQELRQYNLVAGEFQLFQVLLYRFMENELFQGPRVQNYAKNRCVFRNLLQVPVVKDDSSKNKGKGDVEDAITTRMLSNIIEESMRVFWEFLHADKEENNLILQGHQQPHSIPRDSPDAELLSEIRTNVHKKEKKLKDILRSGNCIVKRFQKQHDNDQVPEESLLVAQVELKLVSRVLNMRKLTADQLIWCHEKLDRITICNRKVVVEPSFLLFPC
ncbi:hypothetical protein Tsubulata_029305 [Turnera subulata]|uniref:Ribosomal protein L34Ae n=1 Tax=Turnera subulata TaxID=218843 RepID=A0A9Q0FDY8_9ROSI|nr:hypothetical protein Tsubulata_029305 [Turnera subulata]